MVSDCYTPVINGVVTSIGCLIGALEAEGHEVVLCCPGHETVTEAEPGVVRFRSSPFWFHKAERFTFPWPPRSLGAFSLPFDVVHIHTPFNLGSLGALAALMRGLPSVFTHHTLWEEYVHYLPVPEAVLKPVARHLCRTFAQAADRVVAPSFQVRERLRAQGVSRAIDVVPTGIDPEVFRGGSPQEAASELGLGQEDRLFVYIGRVAKEKSIDFVLRAFSMASQDRDDLALVVVGDGPARNSLEQLAAKLGGRISFVGFQPRPCLKHYLARASGFLFASQTETQGLVLLEAQAAGVPVVAVSASGTSEAVEAGRTGVLLEPDDLEAFASWIERLADEPELGRQWGQNGASWAQEFSSSSMAFKMVKTYRAATLEKRPKMLL